MTCPYPSKCIHDAYRKTGRHLCTCVQCAYPKAQEAAVRREIEWVKNYDRHSFKAAEKLRRLTVELQEIMARGSG